MRRLTQPVKLRPLDVAEAKAQCKRQLERTVRLVNGGTVCRYFASLAMYFVPKLGDGITTSRAMACANGRPRALAVSRLPKGRQPV